MSERKRSARPQDDDWDTGVYVRQTDQPASSEDSEDPSVSRVHRPGAEEIFHDEFSDEDMEMTLAELLYSTSSFYAIAIPGMDFLIIRGVC